jgi:hypothetical protein
MKGEDELGGGYDQYKTPKFSVNVMVIFFFLAKNKHTDETIKACVPCLHV